MPEQPDDLMRRIRWFLSSRIPAGSQMSSFLIAHASAQRHRIEQERRRFLAPGGPGSVNWTPLGPSAVIHGQASGHPAVSGRITALAVGPGGTRVYAGAANGGTWFSGDGGGTWMPLDDYATSPSFDTQLEADSLSVGAIAVSFGANGPNDTIFVGSGEPQSGQDLPVGDGYFGIGIRYSQGGGVPGSWTLEGTNLAGHGLFKIIIDPDDSTLVYAATSQGLYQRPTNGDFRRWNQVSEGFAHPFGAVSDLIVAGSGSNKLYYAAFWGEQVYSSPDGASWMPLPLPSTTSIGRIALAAGENDPSVVYALADNGSLYRLDNGRFQPVNGVPQALFLSRAFGASQGRYDIILAVDPADANTVYLGGDLTYDGDYCLSLYKGTIIGQAGRYTFPFNRANDIFINASGQPDSSRVPLDATWIGRGIHADGHTLAFATNQDGTHDGTLVWVGTDGGLFQSSTSGVVGSFISRNSGLAITEMTYIAQRQDTDAVLFGGCQDSGTIRYWGEHAWFESPEGDGGGVAIDPNNPAQVMRQYHSALLSTCSDGGVSGTWTDLYYTGKFPPVTTNTPAQLRAASTEGDGNHCAFYGPIVTSPGGVVPTLAAFGTHRLWLTADWGNSWVTLPTGTNPYVPTIPDLSQDQLDGTPIRTIAFPSAGLIFVATQNQVWRFDQSGSAWTCTPLSIANLPNSSIITALAVENALVGSLYVTLGGGGVDHVWYYDGTSWQNAGLDITIVDAPAHAIVVDPSNPHTLYVGTDVGCWRGTKISTGNWAWSLFSQGLPEAAITDLGIHVQARLMRAATHGRGVWEIRLDDTSSSDPDLYLRANYADSGRIQGGSRFPWVDGSQDPTSLDARVTHAMSADIKVRRGSLGGLPPLSVPPNYLDFASAIGDQIDAATRCETADATGSNRIFVQVHNRGLTAIAGNLVWVLLLLADAPAALPLLPTDYATRINAADTSTNWLANSLWSFADAVTPYRPLAGTLDVRIPQIVEFEVDFSTLALPSGHNQVCAAAFVTTSLAAEQLTSKSTDLDHLTLQDKHVVFRLLRLI